MTTVDNLFKWFMMNQFYQRLVSSDLHGLQFTLPTLDVFLLPPSNLSITVCRRRRRQFLTATFFFSFTIVSSFPQQPLVVDHHLFHKIPIPLKHQKTKPRNKSTKKE